MNSSTDAAPLCARRFVVLDRVRAVTDGRIVPSTHLCVKLAANFPPLLDYAGSELTKPAGRSRWRRRFVRGTIGTRVTLDGDLDRGRTVPVDRSPVGGDRHGDGTRGGVPDDGDRRRHQLARRGVDSRRLQLREPVSLETASLGT